MKTVRRAELAFWSIFWKLPDLTLFIELDGVKFAFSSRRPHDVLVASGLYELNLVRRAMSVLRVGDVFLDVGAHIGAYTLRAAKRVGESGRVYAVEPDPMNARLLRSSVRVNGFSNVIVIEAAASDVEGDAEFWMHPKGDMSSVGRMWGGNRLTKVRTIRLSKIINEDDVRLVKVDVEGYEDRIIPDLLDNIKFDYALIETHTPHGKSICKLMNRPNIESKILRVSATGQILWIKNISSCSMKNKD
jgi:FkbM family methyltransferase